MKAMTDNRKKAMIIEAAYLAGFEPSTDNLTNEALFEEAIEFLVSTK